MSIGIVVAFGGSPPLAPRGADGISLNARASSGKAVRDGGPSEQTPPPATVLISGCGQNARTNGSWSGQTNATHYTARQQDLAGK